MKGLLVKEKCSIWNTCRTFLIIPVFFYAALIAGVIHKGMDIDGFPIGMVYMMMGLMPISVINQEMTSRWHINALTMPYTRAQIVSAKYIAVLMINALTTIMSAAILLICLAAFGSKGGSAAAICKMLFGGIGMGLMPAAVFLPTNYKYYDSIGGKRMVISMLAGGTIGACNMVIMERVQKGSLFGGGFVFMCLMIVLFIVSWLLSIAFFSKKDV